MEAGKDVMTIGSQGDLFYFILEGTVEVRLPDEANKNAYEDI